MSGRYLIALGSNVPHPGHGRPRDVLVAALAAVDAAGAPVESRSSIVESAPLGPSRRRYANGAAVVRWSGDPPGLLALLQQVEHDFGRIRRGARWGARTLDLDIVLWEGGCWSDDALTIPHQEFRSRTFVLGPARAVAPRWRDPLTGLCVQHLYARLTRRRHAPR